MTKAGNADLAKLMALLGKEDDPTLQELLTTAPEKLANDKKNKELRVIREAEAVLRHLYYPATLKQVLCRNCGEPFATNYEFEKYCTDECRRRALKKEGIDWDVNKDPQERWQGQPPSTISTETLARLKVWAREILAWDEPEKPDRETAMEVPPLGEVYVTDVVLPDRDPYAFLNSLK